jgi:beta-mannanase
MSTLNNQVAKTENNLMDKRESRSQSMKWFNEIRNNKTVINTIDTILLGAYDDATQESYENIITLEDSLKTKLPIISVYTAWGSKKDQVFPMLRAQAIYDLGSIPMITWEPWLNDFDPKRFSFNAQAVNKNKGGLRAVAEGRYDDYIDKWAMDAKKFGLPFYLRWGHEMNDPYRYPWGQQNNAPEDYIDAWRYVVQRFRQVGATNVIWIWSPHPAYPFDLFYPGDEYVDWTALTALNYGTVATWSQWWSFNDIIGKAYKKIAVYGKPVMLAEFGSLEVGGNRSLWYKDALGSLPQKYPAVRALVFFHASNDLSTTYKALDWSFEHDKKVLDSAKAALAKW